MAATGSGRHRRGRSRVAGPRGLQQDLHQRSGHDAGHLSATDRPADTCCASRHLHPVRVCYDYKNYPLMPKFPGLGLLLPDTLKSTSIAQVN